MLRTTRGCGWSTAVHVGCEMRALCHSRAKDQARKCRKECCLLLPHIKALDGVLVCVRIAHQVYTRFPGIEAVPNTVGIVVVRKPVPGVYSGRRTVLTEVPGTSKNHSQQFHSRVVCEGVGQDSDAICL